MNAEDRARVIRGLVRRKEGWVPIERQIELEAARRRKIEEGYVFFQGEWIPIEDKIARTVPRAPQHAEPPSHQVTINRQVYNLDNRTYNTRVDQSRHLHVDPRSLAQSGRVDGALPGPPARGTPDELTRREEPEGWDRRRVTDRRSSPDPQLPSPDPETGSPSPPEDRRGSAPDPFDFG